MTDLSIPGVFENQKKAWASVEQLVADNLARGISFSRVVLLAQPQVGKTSFMVWGAIQRAMKAEQLGLASFNVIGISDANNALRDQTHNDLANALQQSGLKGNHQFIVDHRTNLKYIDLPEDALLTVFIDEAHIAARVGGARDSFQRRVYDYEGDRLLVDVGATSFAHIALYGSPETPYDAVVNLEPGPAYNSIEWMYDQGRIRQVEKLVNKNGTPTRFLAERIATLQRHGGYTIIRATGKRHTALIRALRLLAPTMPLIEADMFKTAVAGRHVAISAIPEILCQKPDSPTVVLVRGALRVGIVLPPKASKNICEMVDTNSVRADTATQSFIGRSCGYYKRKDTYSIFSNLKDIETVLDFYRDVKGAIPVGLKNTGAHRAGRYEVVPFENAYQTDAVVSRCSLNNENDVADHVLRGVNTWDGRFVLIDKPNPNFSQSWQRLVSQLPELVGHYVTFNPERNWYKGAEIHDNFIDLNYLSE